jgi:hypothetical protein
MFGVIRQINQTAPFVYCMAETKERAESIAKTAAQNEIIKNSQYFVCEVRKNTCIGDDYHLQVLKGF